MAENSKIEWTDHTFNPWEGCTKVSPGCLHCYAEALRDLRYGAVKWGKGQPRRRTAPDNWKKPLRWNDTAVCGSCGKHAKNAAIAGNLGKCPVCHEDTMRRPRVFSASLADWLDDEVQIGWLADFLRLIRDTPNVDWLLLTKRPENWRSRVEAAQDWHFDFGDRNVAGWIQDWWKHSIYPGNVWLGTTVEDQTRADERIPLLEAIPAKVRFLSCEPLLGPVDLSYHFRLQTTFPCKLEDGLVVPTGPDTIERQPANPFDVEDGHRIHWVICGGESGHDARPMHPEWARSLRNQCAAAGVPFLFKQWGEWAPGSNFPEDVAIPSGESCDFGQDLDDNGRVWKVGKKKAGRVLDGEEHNGFPGQ
jgi:protein gp37